MSKNKRGSIKAGIQRSKIKVPAVIDVNKLVAVLILSPTKSLKLSQKNCVAFFI